MGRIYSLFAILLIVNQSIYALGIGINFNNSTGRNEIHVFDPVNDTTVQLSSFRFESGSWPSYSFCVDAKAGYAFAADSASKIYVFNLISGDLVQSYRPEANLLGFRPAGDGKLFGVGSDNRTYLINPVSGETSTLASYSIPDSEHIRVDGFSSDVKNGLFYMVSLNMLFQFDMATGELLNQSEFQLTGITDVMNMGVNSDGDPVALAITREEGSTEQSWILLKVDPVDGSTSLLTHGIDFTGFTSLGSIHFESTSDVISMVYQNELFRFSMRTGQRLLKTTIDAMQTLKFYSPQVNVPGSTSADSYRMICLPSTSQDSAWRLLTDTHGEYDPMVWRVFGYDPELEGYVEGEDIPYIKDTEGRSRAISFWLINREDTEFVTKEQPDSSEELALTLKSGWTMIGNPFQVKIDTSHLQVDLGDGQGFQALSDQSTVGRTVFTLDNETLDYVDGTAMLPFVGYWILNSSDSPIEMKILSPYTNPNAALGRPVPVRLQEKNHY